MEDGADETDNMMASVNSLASDATGSSSKAGRRTSTHQLKESLSSSQLASSKSSTGGPPSPSDVRGRPLSRPTTSIHPPLPMGAAVSRSPETNRSTTGGPSTERRSMSRKRTKSGTLAGGRGKEATAGLVLLSLVAVVGLRGMSAGRETGAVSSYPTEGRVLVSSSVSSTSSLDEVVPPPFNPPSPLTHPVRLSSTANANGTHPDRPARPPHHPSTPPPTWQRAIGRVSAWTCTVLYLTSRMPQIWKNVRSALNPRHLSVPPDPTTADPFLSLLPPPKNKIRNPVYAKVSRGPRDPAVCSRLLRKLFLRRVHLDEPSDGPAEAKVDRVHIGEFALLTWQVRLLSFLLTLLWVVKPRLQRHASH